ncbi:MAG: protein kinase [Planctomycetales bacterium]|nr:protein kinase [Planctomycetales bacterium]
MLDHHPTRMQLAAFSSGQLAPPEAAKIESHINTCSPCCETLLELKQNDTFIELLKNVQAEPTTQSATHPCCGGEEAVSDNTAAFSIDQATDCGVTIPEGLRDHPRYRIVEHVGKGGMGEVYKAEHRMMERTVAIKMINQAFVQNQQASVRFHREVKAAAKLAHPNIVTAYDAEQLDNTHFLVMEYVDGIDLAELVKHKGPLSVADACLYIQQAAHGLHHAFEHGMVHRDIKPHNLMVTNQLSTAEDGTNRACVKILDFGLATLSSDAIVIMESKSADTGLTLAGTVMGSPDFISPEQVVDARKVDIRSDVYSLGATFYFLLSGHAPFPAGNLPEKLQIRQVSDPLPIHQIRDDLPPGLGAVVDKMMARDPANRWQTPRQVVDALEPFVHSDRTKIVQPATTSLKPSSLRNWKTMLASVLAVVSLSWLAGWSQTGTVSLDTPDNAVRVHVQRVSSSTLSAQAGTDGADGEKLFELTAQSPTRFWQGSYRVSLASPFERDYELVQSQITLLAGEAKAIQVRERTKLSGDGQASANARDATVSNSTKAELAETPAANANPRTENEALLVVEPMAAFAIQPEKDVYFSASMHDLAFDADNNSLSDEDLSAFRRRNVSQDWLWTYVALDGPGDAYISPPQIRSGREVDNIIYIVARVPSAVEVKGTLHFPAVDGMGMSAKQFTISETAWQPAGKSHQRHFFEVMRDHYQFLVSRRIPGSAWFRNRAEFAARQLGTIAEDANLQEVRAARQASSPVDNTYDLWSGGRAISENLRLDDVLENGTDLVRSVDIHSITGITVNEFDWQDLNRGLAPELDPLARAIPGDQHVLFFPQFQDLVYTLDHADRDGHDLVQWVTLASDRTDILARYEAQLGLSLNELSRMLGPQLISSVAVTGSDPYFDIGTDVALVLEPKNVSALMQMLQAQLALSAAGVSKPITGSAGTVTYLHYNTPLRHLHTFLAEVEGIVILTNSLAQLKCLVATISGDRESIQASPEYTFFRHRYPIQQSGRGGLLIITDQAIRRWCSPRWRIAASRRLIAHSAMSAANAEYLSAGMRRETLDADAIAKYKTNFNEMSIVDGRVRSHYGSLDYLIPIAELDVDMVTEHERDAYVRWRQRFEGRWRRSFDPIAVSFQADDQLWSADVTVMPLAANSSYDFLRTLTQGAKLNPAAADSHPESLVNWSLSIDRKSTWMNFLSSAIAGDLPVPLRTDPFAWFGGTISLYADADPFWDKADRNQFDWISLTAQAPVAINLEIADHVRLLPFLIGLRRFIEGTSPGLTRWETTDYRGHQYTRVGLRQSDKNAAFYYVVAGDLLVISLNESLIHRALDRAMLGAESNANQPVVDPPESNDPSNEPMLSNQWLGENLALQLNGKFLPALDRLLFNNFEQQLRFTAWKNIPILNEWKKAFPDSDPLQIHARYWRQNLVCVDGGSYRWNEALGSMEASIFGPPGTKVDEAFKLPVPFRDVTSAAFGLTFENSGVRGRVRLERHKDGK